MPVGLRHTALASVMTSVLLSGGAVADTPLAVEVVTVEAASVPRVFSGTGEIVARDLRSLSFPAGGRVVTVLVDIGDRVRRGQELAQLDPVQQEQRLLVAKAALARAEADAAKARDDDARMEKLLAQGRRRGRSVTMRARR